MNTSSSPWLQNDLPLWGGVTPYWRRFFGHYGGLASATTVLGLLWLFTDIWVFDRESTMTAQIIMHLFATLTLAVLMSFVSIYIQKRCLCQMRILRVPGLARAQRREDYIAHKR